MTLRLRWRVCTDSGLVDGADEQGHVVVLGGSMGEAVGGLDDAGDELLGGSGAGGLGEEGLCGRDHVGFAPLFFGGVHGFGDAVGEGYEDVSGLEADGGAGVHDVGD
jgi:hypothetical protein